MRRLLRDKMLDAMLERQEVAEETIVTVAHMLAQFYRQQKPVDRYRPSIFGGSDGT